MELKESQMISSEKNAYKLFYVYINVPLSC